MPKSWFERTDRRSYEGQLSQIERRQARLNRIRHIVTDDMSTQRSTQGKERSAGNTQAIPKEGSPTESGSSEKENSSDGRSPKDGDLTAIGTRQQEKLAQSTCTEDDELEKEDTPDQKYVIGKNQNNPLDMIYLLHNPAISHKDPYLIVRPLRFSLLYAGL